MTIVAPLRRPKADAKAPAERVLLLQVGRAERHYWRDRHNYDLGRHDGPRSIGLLTIAWPVKKQGDDDQHRPNCRREQQRNGIRSQPGFGERVV